MANNGNNDKSLESWIWDAACSIRGAKDAPKYKEYILPLIFAKRLCDVFDDELNRIAKEVGSRAKAFKLVKHDKKLVRFFLPLEPKNPDDPVWSIIRKLADKIGEQLTTLLRDIADENSLLKGIIDRVDFNATTHGVRDLDELRPQFLRYYINSPVGRPRIMKLAQGAIQKNISGTALKNFSVPVPRVEEQQEIEVHVKAVDQRLRIQTQKKLTLSDLFRTLLHQLMTAQIRVNDLDLEEILPL